MRNLTIIANDIVTNINKNYITNRLYDYEFEILEPQTMIVYGIYFNDSYTEELYSIYKKFKKRINNKNLNEKQLNEIIKKIEYKYDISIAEIKQFDNIPYVTLDNNRLMYNLLTDTHEIMKYKNDACIDINYFAKEINKLKNKQQNIIVNFINIVYDELGYHEEFLDYIMNDILNETEYKNQPFDYSLLLDNFANIIKQTYDINNIYVYDFSEKYKYFPLNLNLYFSKKIIKDFTEIKLITQNILDKYIIDKNKYKIEIGHEYYLYITFNLSFTEYIELVKTLILYNTITEIN